MPSLLQFYEIKETMAKISKKINSTLENQGFLVRMNVRKTFEKIGKNLFEGKICFFRAAKLVLIWFMYCGVLFCHSLLNNSLVTTTGCWDYFTLNYNSWPFWLMHYNRQTTTKMMAYEAGGCPPLCIYSFSNGHPLLSLSQMDIPRKHTLEIINVF